MFGSSLGTSGYSNFTPGSQVNVGQQYGNEAVLLVFSVSSLHLSLANGNGPQSSTNSNNLKERKKTFFLMTLSHRIKEKKNKLYILGWIIFATHTGGTTAERC